ncbi:MAG: AMP-binding protein [Deltaproteobacteria bacterium]|nr:AMP-binding protein [Deltaproteobacteria bacterium]
MVRAPMLFDRAESAADALALDDGHRRRTFGELDQCVARIARWLRDGLGLGADDHVTTLVGNRVEAVELILGAFAAGVWITPLNWHLTADELAYIVADAGARLLVTDAEHAALARAAVAPLAAPPRVVEVGDDLDALLAATPAAPLPSPAPPAAR